MIRALIAPLVLIVPMLLLGQQLLGLLMRPVEKALLEAGLPPRLQVLSPTEAFITYFKVAFAIALVAAGPAIIWQAWRFVAPGLYDREKRFAKLLVPFSALLTVTGACFLYFVVLPLSLNWLIGFGQGIELSSDLPRPAWIAPDNDAAGADPTAANGHVGGTPDPVAADAATLAEIPVLVEPPKAMRSGEMFVHAPTQQLWIMMPGGRLVAADLRPLGVPFEQQFQLRTYINFVFVLMTGFAIAFQLPLVLMLLGWVNLITPDQLAANRKYALLVMFVVGAVLTPPDVVSQIALAVPMYALFELSIWLLRFVPASRVAGGAEPGPVEH